VNTEDLLDATPTEVSAGAASDTSIVTSLPDAESITTAPSLFGDDGPAGTPQLDAAADFFSCMGISRSTNEAVPVVPHTNYGIDSSVAATIGSCLGHSQKPYFPHLLATSKALYPYVSPWSALPM